MFDCWPSGWEETLRKLLESEEDDHDENDDDYYDGDYEDGGIPILAMFFGA